MLSIDQIASYHRDGFLAIEDFVTPDACRALRQRADEIVDTFVPSAERTVFTTDEQERTSNREFLDSGSGIWCFFEEEAFGARRRAGAGQGAEHQQDRPRHARPRPGVRVVQLHAAARRGRRRHRPRRPAGAAEHVHLQAAVHRRRGRLPPGRAVPLHRPDHRHRLLVRHRGRHARQRLPVGRSPAVTAARCAACTNASTPTIPTAATGPPASSSSTTRRCPIRPNGLVPIVAPAGTMVILHGLLPHWSDVNRSPASRHAYSLHCISEAADYPAWNWLQRPAVAAAAPPRPRRRGQPAERRRSLTA